MTQHDPLNIHMKYVPQVGGFGPSQFCLNLKIIMIILLFFFFEGMIILLLKCIEPHFYNFISYGVQYISTMRSFT